MKRILGEVSVKELDGCLKKIMELLKHKELGHYYLHELGQFLSEVPAKVLYQKWLNELSSFFIWRRAEEHFKKTKQLWYNELVWPFQIAVLEIGGLSNKDLLKKWREKFPDCYGNDMDRIMQYINDLDLSVRTKKKKIFLIRFQAKYLGFSGQTPFSEMNCNHPELNLSLCPPETSFLVRLLIKEYIDQASTIFATEFKPSTVGNKEEKRVYCLNNPNGYQNNIYMNPWDMKPNDTLSSENYWIFQYNQTEKNSINNL